MIRMDIKIKRSGKDKFKLTVKQDASIYVEARGNVWVVFDESGDAIKSFNSSSKALAYAKAYLKKKY